jgi:hypothetical protein
MRQLFVHQHHEHSHKTRPSSGNAKVHPDGEEDEEDDVSVSDQSSVHDSDLALIERGGTPPDKPPKTGAGKDADRCEISLACLPGRLMPIAMRMTQALSNTRV